MAIGRQCSNRLPPASAVQAMYLYEFQRETEAERLFQGAMFELARAEKQSKSQDVRLQQLEEDLQALRKQSTAKDIEKRIATSRVQMDLLSGKIEGHVKRADACYERLDKVEEQVQKLMTSKNICQDEGPGQSEGNADKTKASTDMSASIQILTNELSALNDDVGILFDERDALIQQIKDINQRVDELEKHGKDKQAALEDQARKLVAKLETEVHEAIENVKNLLTARVDSNWQQSKLHIGRIEEQAKTNTAARVAAENQISETMNESMREVVQKVYAELKVEEFESWRFANETKKAADVRMTEMQQASDDRFGKLEGLVRALTLQMSAVNHRTTTALQILPVQTTDGQLLDLSVPKGKPLISYDKENQAPVRNFTPGKQWTS